MLASRDLSRRSERPYPTPFLAELVDPEVPYQSSRSARSSRSNREFQKKGPRIIKIPRNNSQNIYPPPVYDELQLKHQYELLSHDINSLHTEIQPIRQELIGLKDQALFKSRCTDNAALDFQTYAPNLSQAIGNGKFSATIQKFQEEAKVNTTQITQMTEELKDNSHIKLIKEVEDSRTELREMRKNLEQLKEETRAISDKLLELKKSSLSEDIQEQRKQLKLLQNRINKVEERNLILKREEQELEASPVNLTEEQQDDIHEVEQLQEQLALIRKRYVDKCDKLLEIKTKQVAEIKEMQDRIDSTSPKKVMEPETSSGNRSRRSYKDLPSPYGNYIDQMITEPLPNLLIKTTSSRSVYDEDFIQNEITNL